MEVSPGEVHDLYNEGLSAREIARRLKISRTWVKFKLREYELDKREYDLDDRKIDLDIKEADLEARKKEIDMIPELEERAHFLESEVDRLTKKKNEQEETIRTNEETLRSKEEVLEKINDYEERSEEAVKKLSNLSNRVDLQKKSAEKLEVTQKQLDATQKQVKTESITLRRIEDAIAINRNINRKLADENSHLEEEKRVKKKAINEIEQSYYGFAERTKQIALFMPAGSDTKIKTHEETRKKVLKGIEMIAEEAKITKPKSESDLEALLRDPSILKKISL